MKTRSNVSASKAAHAFLVNASMRALGLLTAPLLASAAFAQSGGGFTLDWSTLDGGGGASTGGGFTLAGTIGQPDAGVMTGDGFAVTGGFWSLFSTHLPTQPPSLSIRRTGANAVLAWPAAVNGYTLEYTTQLGSGFWTTETTPVVNTATEHTVTVPANSGRRFYRLKK